MSSSEKELVLRKRKLEDLLRKEMFSKEAKSRNRSASEEDSSSKDKNSSSDSNSSDSESSSSSDRSSKMDSRKNTETIVDKCKSLKVRSNNRFSPTKNKKTKYSHQSEDEVDQSKNVRKRSRSKSIELDDNIRSKRKRSDHVNRSFRDIPQSSETRDRNKSISVERRDRKKSKSVERRDRKRSRSAEIRDRKRSRSAEIRDRKWSRSTEKRDKKRSNGAENGSRRKSRSTEERDMRSKCTDKRDIKRSISTENREKRRSRSTEKRYKRRSRSKEMRDRKRSRSKEMRDRRRSRSKEMRDRRRSRSKEMLDRKRSRSKEMRDRKRSRSKEMRDRKRSRSKEMRDRKKSRSKEMRDRKRSRSLESRDRKRPINTESRDKKARSAERCSKKSSGNGGRRERNRSKSRGSRERRKSGSMEKHERKKSKKTEILNRNRSGSTDKDNQKISEDKRNELDRIESNAIESGSGEETTKREDCKLLDANISDGMNHEDERNTKEQVIEEKDKNDSRSGYIKTVERKISNNKLTSRCSEDAEGLQSRCTDTEQDHSRSSEVTASQAKSSGDYPNASKDNEDIVSVQNKKNSEQIKSRDEKENSKTNTKTRDTTDSVEMGHLENNKNVKATEIRFVGSKYVESTKKTESSSSDSGKLNDKEGESFVEEIIDSNLNKTTSNTENSSVLHSTSQDNIEDAEDGELSESRTSDVEQGRHKHDSVRPHLGDNESRIQDVRDLEPLQRYEDEVIGSRYWGGGVEFNNNRNRKSHDGLPKLSDDRKRDRNDRQRAKDYESKHKRNRYNRNDVDQNRNDVEKANGEEKVRKKARADLEDTNSTKPSTKKDDPIIKKPVVDPLQTKSGGAYIPPAKLRMMQAEITDKSSAAFQRLAWEALKKSINGLVNKVNVSNIGIIVRELFKENVIRGRGILCRSLMQAQSFSQTFTPVYAALVAVINSKFPQIGDLLLKRLVIQLRRAVKRNDKTICLSSIRFIAHLVNQDVAHEILALELLTFFLEKVQDMDDSESAVKSRNNCAELTVAFVKECGHKLMETNYKCMLSVVENIKVVMHRGNLEDRIHYMLEAIWQDIRVGFKDNPAVKEELDLVEQEDQITHAIELDGVIDTEDILNVFKYDPDYQTNEEKYKEIKSSILGESSDEEDGSDGDGEDSSDSESDDDDENNEKEKDSQDIVDMTEGNMLAFRRTVYLTFKSSLTVDEAAHKLLKGEIKPGWESELCNMILDCCAQERTFMKFYALLAQRFCKINRVYQESFEEIFSVAYDTCHRLDAEKLRNVAKLFSHLFVTDAISWAGFHIVKLNEDQTTSSSRVFLKILFQEMVEHLSLSKLNDRLRDPTLAAAYEGLLPRDNPRNTRFAINFFTSLGLGGLTDDLREFLRNQPKPTAVVAPVQQLSSSQTADDSSSASSSSSSSASSSVSSSSSSSNSSSSDYSSSSSDSSSTTSSSSSSDEDASPRRRRRKKLTRSFHDMRRRAAAERRTARERCPKERHQPMRPFRGRSQSSDGEQRHSRLRDRCPVDHREHMARGTLGSQDKDKKKVDHGERRSPDNEPKELRSGRYDKEEHRSGLSNKEEHKSGRPDKEEHKSGRSDNEEHRSVLSDKEDRRSRRADKKEHRSRRSDKEGHTSRFSNKEGLRSEKSDSTELRSGSSDKEERVSGRSARERRSGRSDKKERLSSRSDKREKHSSREFRTEQSRR